MDHVSPEWQPFMLSGAFAFVLTALHAALSLPVFYRMILRNGYPRKSLLFIFFIAGTLMHLLWQLYLWPQYNLFIRIGLGLQTLLYLLLLVQMFFFLLKNPLTHGESRKSKE
jgi:hypothetical protein